MKCSPCGCVEARILCLALCNFQAILAGLLYEENEGFSAFYQTLSRRLKAGNSSS